ncbi:MAG: ATP synthase F1 subunit gamma [Methylacidiphilales bacterium]|nr:ATP synthase F1 subunit gamma [Candidatus Methylacidiphilales bacterium]MDW8348802.1 ATP synthase F1 subunit gamma [Verrucomicrobiae bacterium]
MANLREIRRRIKSIKNTAQITKAMQMVAASKMRKAQQQALASAPYQRILDHIARSLHEARSGADLTHPLLDARPLRRQTIVLITTDKGLCGALNSNLLRETLKYEKESPDVSFDYITIGRKGRQFIARLGRSLTADFELKESFGFRDTKKISQFLIQSFLDNQTDKIIVAYSEFINTLAQKPVLTQLLPLGSAATVTTSALSDASPSDNSPVAQYLFEPHPVELLNNMLPYFVHYSLYQKVLSARASEHSARMVAMKNATDNAQTIIKELTLDYNKQRQANITTELLEIATAQMAMNQ